jgi:hypothetical protein
LVEAAIVLPVFVTIIFGIIETGLLIWTQLSLNYAVAQAARCAAINNNLCGNPVAIQSYARQQVPIIPNLTTSNFAVVTAAPSCGNGNKQVSVSYPFVSMIPPLVPYSLTLQATACYKTS